MFRLCFQVFFFFTSRTFQNSRNHILVKKKKIIFISDRNEGTIGFTITCFYLFIYIIFHKFYSYNF